MIYWAPFLHFYQPPTQFHAILEKICDESYRPLFKILSDHPRTRVTINICGVLTEMLNDHGGEDILLSLKELAGAGKLEFIESAKYHAILPLIPPEEIQRQIDLNHKTNSYFFKSLYKVRGFFSPEMCYSDELAGILRDMGYDWFVTSGVSCTAAWPLDVIYKIPFGKDGITVFYRDDVLSNKISFHGIDSRGFISELVGLSKGRKDIYVITAMDAETFGHHIQNWEELFLAEIYKILEGGTPKYAQLRQKTDLAERHKGILDSGAVDKIKVVTISELLTRFPIKSSTPPAPSSWSTTKEDIQKQNYYPLWKDSSNLIHKLQWEHVGMCFGLINTTMKIRHSKDSQPFADIARSLLDSAIHSCQFWWANKGRMWNVNLVNKGLLLQEEALFNAYKAIAISGCEEDIKKDSYHDLIAARDIANKIRDQLFKP